MLILDHLENQMWKALVVVTSLVSVGVTALVICVSPEITESAWAQFLSVAVRLSRFREVRIWEV